MRISDWSSDVFSSDLIRHLIPRSNAVEQMGEGASPAMLLFPRFGFEPATRPVARSECFMRLTQASTNYVALGEAGFAALTRFIDRSEEHTSELQSLMRISYAVFCLKKKNNN